MTEYHYNHEAHGWFKRSNLWEKMSMVNPFTQSRIQDFQIEGAQIITNTLCTVHPGGGGGGVLRFGSDGGVRWSRQTNTYL